MFWKIVEIGLNNWWSNLFENVFRKAMGDGKRAILLQRDWAKVHHFCYYTLNIYRLFHPPHTSQFSLPYSFLCFLCHGPGPLSLLWCLVLSRSQRQSIRSQRYSSELLHRRSGGNERPPAAVYSLHEWVRTGPQHVQRMIEHIVR